MAVTSDRPFLVNEYSTRTGVSGTTVDFIGLLQSKTWGWIIPLQTPEINGYPVAPFGISLTTWFVLAGGLIGCSQSDKELCEDVHKKLNECGSPTSGKCPENLADEVREQYECIMDTECIDLADCAS